MRDQENLVKTTLHLQEFKAWLQEKGSLYVMAANSTDACPLACYLKDRLSLENLAVFPTMIRVETTYVDLKDTWVTTFIDQVDLLQEESTFYQPVVSVEQALEALAVAEQRPIMK